jgi:hypothetical protein
MNTDRSLAERFEAHRPHLRAVAYRLLGSTHDADEEVALAESVGRALLVVPDRTPGNRSATADSRRPDRGDRHYR